MLPADPKLAFFYRYLSQAIQAELPIDRALADSAGPARGYCRKLVQQLAAGDELWDAIDALVPDMHKPILRNASPGYRAQVLEGIAATVEQEKAFGDGLKKVLLPPFAFLLFTSVAIAVVCARHEAQILRFFDEFRGGPVPRIFQIPLFLAEWWELFVVLAVVCAGLLLLLARDRIQFSTPTTVEATVEARILTLWSRLIPIGVTDSDLLAITAAYVNAGVYRDHVERWQNAIGPTRSLADEVVSDPFAPTQLRACFTAANPPEALERVAAQRRERMLWHASNLSAMGGCGAILLVLLAALLVGVYMGQFF